MKPTRNPYEIEAAAQVPVWDRTILCAGEWEASPADRRIRLLPEHDPAFVICFDADHTAPVLGVIPWCAAAFAMQAGYCGA